MTISPEAEFGFFGGHRVDNNIHGVTIKIHAKPNETLIYFLTLKLRGKITDVDQEEKKQCNTTYFWDQ